MSLVEVKITAADIEKQILQAVIDSDLGEKIKVGIQKKIEEISKQSFYDNEITKIITQEITTVVKQELAIQHKDKIKELVQKLITEKKVEDIITAIWTKLDRGW